MIQDFLVITILFSFAFMLRKLFPKYSWILPSSIIAGIIGLIISEQALGLYHFKGDLKLYIDIFLSFVFATFPLTIKNLNFSFVRKIKPLWKYSTLQYFSQWGISLFITVILVKHIWPMADDTFGLVLPSGFAGGHGSAAVVGDLLNRLGHTDALTLCMSMATLGAFSSIFGGMLWIIWGKKNGLVKYKAQLNSSEIKRKFSFSTFSPLSILVLTTVVIIAFFAKPHIIQILKFDIPIFVISVIVALFARFILKRFIQFDHRTLSEMANISTDLLVCIGIASIKIMVVMQYLWPMLFMAIIGISLCFLFFRLLTPKFFRDDWFEKGLFTWGWSVGGLVFGLALVRIITNKEENARLLQQFAMTYMLLSPIEISLLLSMPYLVHHGYALILSILLILLAIVIIYTQLNNADKSLK